MYNKLMKKITKRILIAEDTLGWQKFHSSLLNEYDNATIDFTIVDCAKDALTLIQENYENPYDLIFTDLQMENDFAPKFAGEWLVEQIKMYNSYKNIPIVIVSAAYNINFIAETLNVDCISKRVLINNPDTYYLKLDEKLF